jgi:hypothetical protein
MGYNSARLKSYSAGLRRQTQRKKSAGESEMFTERKRVQFNYPAIVTAAVACCLLRAVWYSIFFETWLNGMGRNRAWFDGTGVSLILQFCTAFLAAVLLAAAISGFTQLTGLLTARRGAKVAAWLWLGLLLPTEATQSVFAVRTYEAFALNAGFWLLGMAMIGAIVGGWKKGKGRE